MDDRDLQAPLRALADAVPVLIWINGADGRCTFVNARWLEFTGRDIGDELGDGWADNVHPDDLDRCTADHQEAIDLRAPFETEYRLRRADGAWRWILARAVPLTGAGGEFAGFVGSAIDLTERREADAALEQSRAQFAAAMAAGRMGSFDLDLATGHVSRDSNLEALYGLEPGEAATFDAWASLIHPDDRGQLLAEVARVTADGGEYRLEHRIVRPDGQVRWFERRGNAYAGTDGRVAGLRGMVIDVTERKVAELERGALFDRVSRLQEITAALARVGTADEVLEIVVGKAVEAVGASAGSVALLDAGGVALDIALAGGYPPPLLEQFRRMDLEAEVPLAEAARTGLAVVFRDVEEWDSRYPHLPRRSLGSSHVAAAALPLVVDDRVIGAAGLSFDDAQPFDCAQMEFLAAVMAQCAQALDRAWSYMAEAAARKAAEEAQARLALLADASIVLARSLEYEATLPEVAALVVPLLAECCVIDVFEPTEAAGWRRVAATCADPALRNRLLSVPPGAWTEADGLDDSAALGELGLRSALVVPLDARRRTLGMLALLRHEPDAFTDADRALAAGLVTRVAQSVDNARLYRAERRAHEDAERAATQMRFLLDVSTTLAAAMDPQEQLEELARQAAQAVCDLCLVDLADRYGSIRRVAAVSADPALQPAADALRRLTLSDPNSVHPSAVVMRAGRPELCGDVTDDRLRLIATSGTHFEVARIIEPISYVAVPLVGLSRVLGAITLVSTTLSGRRYGEADVALAEDMANRVAMGLERASMHEEMRRVAQTLQASLLPSVPPLIPGLEVGTRYVAAEEGAVVGGDFFDVFAVGPDSWAVVVGDVCGQGVEAATVTGLARHTVRSSALEHDSPATVLAHLNEVLLGVIPDPVRESDARFCTVCLARLEITARGADVTLAMGGHPLPFILGADGAIRQVGRPGSLLGVLPAAVVVDETHAIGPGDALVLYTDGITERHRGHRFFGEQGITAALAASAGLSADEIAGRIEDAAHAFVDGQPTDDMAVVVVRVPPR